MYVHEVHIVNGSVVKLNAPDDLPLVFEASDNLLKFQFANGSTYVFVAANVIYYMTRKVEG